MEVFVSRSTTDGKFLTEFAAILSEDEAAELVNAIETALLFSGSPALAAFYRAVCRTMISARNEKSQ